MKEQQYFKFDAYTVLTGVIFVMICWIVYTVEIKFHLNFNQYGIRPEKLYGIRGVLFAPFIHADINHLWSNTIPALILTVALYYFYRKISWQVFFSGLLLTGLLTWIIARPNYHIGASGVIYMLASFLFFKGIFTRHYRLIALSFIVAFFYGSMVWYVFPIKEGISWEGHLSGGIVGLLLSIVTKSKLPEKKKYQWEQPSYDPENDEFMRHFDEDGNFIEHLEEE